MYRPGFFPLWFSAACGTALGDVSWRACCGACRWFLGLVILNDLRVEHLCAESLFTFWTIIKPDLKKKDHCSEVMSEHLRGSWPLGWWQACLRQHSGPGSCRGGARLASRRCGFPGLGAGVGCLPASVSIPCCSLSSVTVVLGRVCLSLPAPWGLQTQHWTHGGHLGSVPNDTDGHGQEASRAAQAFGLWGTLGSRLVTGGAIAWSRADTQVVLSVWSPDSAWHAWGLRDPHRSPVVPQSAALLPVSEFPFLLKA